MGAFESQAKPVEGTIFQTNSNTYNIFRIFTEKLMVLLLKHRESQKLK